MQFKNPQNDHVETVTSELSWLWVFLWTPIYYAVKGIWIHAIVSLVLGIIGWSVTMGKCETLPARLPQPNRGFGGSTSQLEVELFYCLTPLFCQTSWNICANAAV